MCAFAPLTECSGGVTSVGKLGQWQDMRADFTSPALQNRFYDPQPWGFGTHIYAGGQARPTLGLIYATSDLAKPTQRERLSLSPPQQRSLAPIVNGLLTVDVKWLFCRRIFCLSSALFRSPFSSGRNLEWDYARCHPIQLNLIQFKSQNTNGNQISRCFHVVSCYFSVLG